MRSLQEAVRSQFRPIEELKKDMAQLDIQVETDSQIMARLVAQFNGSSASLEERLKVLLDLEYMVHQVSILEKWNTGGILEAGLDC